MNSSHSPEAPWSSSRAAESSGDEGAPAARPRSSPNNLNAEARKQIDALNIDALRTAVTERLRAENFLVHDLKVEKTKPGRYTVSFVAEDEP